MADRDEFSKKVRQAVALRAAYWCSFEGCDQLTVGPSDESGMGVSRIGVAAHIHGAAQGGKRYLASMTPEQRTHIDNAIWMCASHGTLIDQDDVTYPAERLRAMKTAHEQRIAERVRQGSSTRIPAGDLVALGTSLVCVGELVRVDRAFWQLRIDHFVAGDLRGLVAFVDHFDQLLRADRYVLLNALGDGRVLAQPPVWSKTETGVVIDMQVEPRFPTIRAQDLGTDLKLGDDGDLTEDLATVSGVDALPQKIQLCLWSHKGSMIWAPEFGHRIAEYYAFFRESPWFARLVKMEMIRLAAIPYRDSIGSHEYTPFHCVERVRAIELLASNPKDHHLPVRVHLDVKGLGSWDRDLTLYIENCPFAPSPSPPSTTEFLP